ncbi:MAG: M81 family metallopeptidase [Litorilinea sp.]
MSDAHPPSSFILHPSSFNQRTRMKVFTAFLGTETNTFSPFLTGFANFEQTYLIRDGAHPEPTSSFGLATVTWRTRAQARGWDLVESLCTFAAPAGTTLRHVYESYRDEILRDLQAAGPVDMVLLNMHGAMVADGYDSCEGDFAAAVRAIIGPDVPIGVELDLHCHLTEQLVASADAIITYKEYPHIDIGERADELFTLIADTAEGKIRPRMALYDCGLIGVFHTTREPVQSFVAKMQALEGKDGVLSVSWGHSFPWGDVPELGARVLVVTDNQPDAGAALARQLGEEIYAMREVSQPPYLSVDAALDAATGSATGPVTGPVVLADVADNAGGGAPNDSTFLLQRILERGIKNVAIGCIWDPVVVDIAQEIGEGTTTDLRIGGKMGPMSGDPVDLRVRIGKIAINGIQKFGAGTQVIPAAVALHAPNGVDIVAINRRTQTFSPHVFTNVGIDPTQKQILVVKSMQHFYAAFAPIAAQTLYVSAAGALTPDFAALPYQKARRTLWPLAA